MRALPSILAVSLVLGSSSAALALGPANTKESVLPTETEFELTREEALQELVAGEASIEAENLGEGLTKMAVAYFVLESIDGAEAPGVVELRSWLVKAFETLELPDEAQFMRDRGSYVDHPLSVMPSTWFAGASAGGASEMSLEEAMVAFEDGLKMLEEGEIEGLVVLLVVYDVVEAELGAESDDAIAVRSFLVGLLDVGGYTSEANALRARGSVEPMTAEDEDVYVNTWLRILANEEAGNTPISGGLQKPADPQPQPQDPQPQDPQPDPDPDPDPDPPRDSKVEPGSIVPAGLIDVGLGSYQPELGRKGFIWTLGIQLDWTLFTAGGFFSMELGAGGQFGRNRDKRWLADGFGAAALNFDFRKVYIRPEFGGGYDNIAGGDASPTVAHRVGPAPYYHFGGTLGVRFGERFGLYGRAVRLNRQDTQIRNETRVRGGFVITTEERIGIDLAFVFTDYEPTNDAPGSRLYSGNVGIRF